MPRSISKKYLQKPRQSKSRYSGDGRGGAIHLGERDCSLHDAIRRSGKKALRRRSTRPRPKIGATCAKAMQEMKYLGVGTVEFLYEDGEFYFIEMNTRIQVEHPVTR